MLLYIHLSIVLLFVGYTIADGYAGDRYAELIDRILQLEKKVEKFDNLEERVERLEKIVTVQRSQLISQKRQISKLRTQKKLELLSKDQEEIRNDETTSEGLVPEVVNKIKDKTSVPVRGIRAAPEMPVAFTALLDHNTVHMALDQTVIFNKVLLNDGNAYNIHTGVFTVPREGLYMFYFTFGLGYDPSKLWLRIVVDGKQQVTGVADTLQRGHDAQGGNMALLHLHQGDSVWVNVFMVADVHVYGSTGFTTFSGVLLYEY